MTMPVNLVLVRHGESEGNIANRRSRAGDDGAFTQQFSERHSSLWRLTTRGIAQAKSAGAWLRENLSRGEGVTVFDRYYVSEYVRALETAGHLGLPGAVWFRSAYLRERDWGQLDVMPDAVRRERFAEELARRERDGFFWAPPGGESMATLCLREDRILQTLHRECTDQDVGIVGHGEVMWAYRVLLERMTQPRYRALDASSDPRDHIHNCQILHYSRRDPATRKLASSYRWMRSVCPWDLTKSRNDWEPIERPRHTSEELLAEVETIPRLVDNPADPE
ncbi:MAG: phosphoglycerate mutase family protein [bacterium]|nr:phosphoglycerate mutase family protein [bacterium]